jgi:hypothetical protein
MPSTGITDKLQTLRPVLSEASGMAECHLRMSRRDLIVPSAQPRTWKCCELERRASGWGIAFQRDDRVPHGQALLACDAWAACIVVSHSTAERLGSLDSAALWTAMSCVRQGEPALFGLPAFGGEAGKARALPGGLSDLGEEARKLATSFNPPDDEDDDEDEDEWLDSYWADEETHYRWFMQERAPGVRLLSTFRPALVRELAMLSATNTDTQFRSNSKMKVTRHRGFAILRNETGGRLGRIQRAVRLRHGGKVRDQAQPDNVDVLVLASEYDRPAAVTAYADVGIELAFDPTPGWLDAAVEPGRHGWLVVTWRGAVRGVRVELELANFHIDTEKLIVFAAELCEPVDILLRRNGFQVKEATIAPHPGDPEALFGIDLDDLNELMEQTTDGPPFIDAARSAATARPQPLLDPVSFESRRRRDRRRQNRKLRSGARSLLPEPWAEQIEAVWRPDAPTSADGADDTETSIDKIAPATGFRQVSCRLCDATVVQRIPDTHPYCHDCCIDAQEGLFYDRGFDEPWVGAVMWSLKMLAEHEFGGPPAREQLAHLPAAGPNSDILMLSRMLTARSYETALGSDRMGYAWTDWLAQAGLLTDGVRTGRGVTVIAKDGHLCRSLLERQVDDFFHDHGIAHEPEPHYPFDAEHNPNGYRADWKLSDGTFVEALGFPNDPAYMAKAERKIELGARHRISIVTVTHADIDKLVAIFRKWL